MKRIVINNFTWFFDESSGLIYEHADKTGASFRADNKHVTVSEKKQISTQLYYANPMITH